MVLVSVRHGLTGLARFAGRDRPGLLWPYAGILFVLTMVAWAAVFGRYAIDIEGQYPEVFPNFGYLFEALAVLVGLFVVLIAAAAVRRLHDSDRRGWWGLPPLIFLTIGLVGMGRLFSLTGGDAMPEFWMFGLLFLNNLLYLASLGLLIVQLARSGSPGENRFGLPGV